jgi:flagellar biosynthetic protein FliR
VDHFATAGQVWAGGLVFMRVGAICMLMPGVGEGYVPVRVRLTFALALALCLGPIAAPALPPLPAAVDGMAGYVIKELLIGLMIGGLIRLFVAALTTAGELVSLQTTLSFAQTANPTQAQPATTISAFLTIMGLTLIFDTDLHHMFIAAIAHSYTLFPPAKAIPLIDAGDLAAQTVSKTFALGLQLAAPVVVFALVFNVATGLIGRMMPQFQIFFVATPLSLLLGLSIFALSLGSIGLVWMQNYESFMHLLV